MIDAEDTMIDKVRPEAVHKTLDQGSEHPQHPLVEEKLEGTVAAEDATLPLKKAGFNWRLGLVVLGVLLIGVLGVVGLQSINSSRQAAAKNKDKKERLTPVAVAYATTRTVPIQLQAIGTVQSALTVAVTPQASGKIIGVHFQKGQDIRKGQLLFTLDDQTQSATIQQAQGTLAKDRALVEQARATLEKDRGLVQQARATLEKDQIAVQQAQANLERDLGLIEQAKANLAKSEAQARFAKAQADRYADLLKQGAITQDQAQQYNTNYQAGFATTQADKAAIGNAQAVVKGDYAAIANAQAVVKSDRIAIANTEAVVQGDLAAIQNAQSVLASDEAALKNLQVQLAYTKVYAPVDGRAGNILVNLGNVVQANSNSPLVNILQVHPIQVAFALPEANLADIQKYAENGKLPVSITFASGTEHPIPGVLSFVNNTVDNTTGTIQLIGDFENTDGKLWPGQSVNATLTLTHERNAIVIPTQAVQNGPDGQFVFVVQPDQTVENVPVTVSLTVNGLAVIQKGVNVGDTVVTDGQANLVSGGKVRIKKTGGGNPSGGPQQSEAGSDQGQGKGNSTASGDRTEAPANDSTAKGDQASPGDRTHPPISSASAQTKHRRHSKHSTATGGGNGATGNGGN